jgi:hypothetical protein
MNMKESFFFLFPGAVVLASRRMPRPGPLSESAVCRSREVPLPWIALSGPGIQTTAVSGVPAAFNRLGLELHHMEPWTDSSRITGDSGGECHDAHQVTGASYKRRAWWWWCGVPGEPQGAVSGVPAAYDRLSS